MLNRRIAVALAAAALVIAPLGGDAAPAPVAPAPTVAQVVRGDLTGGGRYVVRVSTSTPSAAVALWYRAPASGFDDPTPGLAQLAAESVAASTPITGTPLGTMIERLGGRLGVSSFPDSVAITAIVPASNAGAVVRAMTAAFFAPVLTESGLQIAKRDVAENAALRAISSDDLLRDTLVSQLFADGPAHYSGLGTPQSVRAIGFDRVNDFAHRAFRSQNAVLVVTGNVDASVVQSAVSGREEQAAGSESRPEANAASTVATNPASVTKEGFEPGFGWGWIGPPIVSEAQATALDFVADYLFRPNSGIVTQQLTSQNVSVTGQFVTYHDPGVMLVSVSGTKTNDARPIVERELERLRRPLDPKVFATARDAFVYHILSDTQTNSEIADTVGWYSVEGAPDYAPGVDGMRGKYLASAAALTPASVAAVVRQYLAKPPVTVTLQERKR